MFHQNCRCFIKIVSFCIFADSTYICYGGRTACIPPLITRVAWNSLRLEWWTEINVAVVHVKLLATARDITIALNRWLFAFNQAKSTAFLWPLVCKLVFPNFLRRLKLSGQLSWKLLPVAHINGAGEVSWLNEVVLTPQVREALFRLRGVGIRKGWEVQWLPQTPENPSLPLRFDQCWPRYLRFADDVLLSAFERRFD